MGDDWFLQVAGYYYIVGQLQTPLGSANRLLITEIKITKNLYKKIIY